jgi:lysophospholipid acyltransferase (LPLAT)-like uncharacterized protein
MVKRVLEILTVSVIAWALRVVRFSWRVEIVNPPPADKGPYLYAHFHGDEVLLVPVFAGRGYAVMVSRSRDGEWMAGVLRRLGYFVVRGSSSRGGAGGLKGLVDAVNVGGRSTAMAVDGPRGPLHKAKPGILFLASATGFPIVPAGGAARSAWKIPKAWNQSYVPKPFSRARVIFGEPFRVPPGVTDAHLHHYTTQIEQALLSLKQDAELGT